MLQNNLNNIILDKKEDLVLKDIFLKLEKEAKAMLEQLNNQQDDLDDFSSDSSDSDEFEILTICDGEVIDLLPTNEEKEQIIEASEVLAIIQLPVEVQAEVRVQVQVQVEDVEEDLEDILLNEEQENVP